MSRYSSKCPRNVSMEIEKNFYLYMNEKLPCQLFFIIKHEFLKIFLINDII